MCSGPPILEVSEAGQDRMSFVTNLKRGQPIGIGGAAALPAESCSADAVFEGGRLAGLSLAGNQGMCELVFAPCLQK
jgi:hypothetical protein